MTSTRSEPAVYRSDPGLGLPVKVLLVEDNPQAAILTWTRVIQPHNNIFQVEWRNTIPGAISRLAKPGIDVVLLDLGMPELAGYQTHLAITSVVEKAVPVVILTGDDSTVMQEITRTQGAANYLVKQRVSSVELRQALYEAVVPAIAPKAPFDVGSRIGKAARHFVTRILLSNLG